MSYREPPQKKRGRKTSLESKNSKARSKEATKDFKASQRTHHTNKVLKTNGANDSGTNGTTQDMIEQTQTRAEATTKIGAAHHGTAAHHRKQMMEKVVEASTVKLR